MAAGEKITALGSSQGNWGALKNAGKLSDFRVLEAKVDPAIFTTQKEGNRFGKMLISHF